MSKEWHLKVVLCRELGSVTTSPDLFVANKKNGEWMSTIHDTPEYMVHMKISVLRENR